MYYVYLIQNEEGKKYIGYTSNMKKRLESHNRNGSKTTRKGRWRLIYCECYLAEGDARRRERSLKKSGRGRELLYKRLEESINC